MLRQTDPLYKSLKKIHDHFKAHPERRLRFRYIKRDGNREVCQECALTVLFSETAQKFLDTRPLNMSRIGEFWVDWRRSKDATQGTPFTEFLRLDDADLIQTMNDQHPDTGLFLEQIQKLLNGEEAQLVDLRKFIPGEELDDRIGRLHNGNPRTVTIIETPEGQRLKTKTAKWI